MLTFSLSSNAVLVAAVRDARWASYTPLSEGRSMFPRQQMLAREKLRAEKPEEKKVERAAAQSTNTQEEILLDARIVLALLLEARKSFQENCALAYARANQLKEAAKSRFKAASAAIMTSGAKRCWVSLATIIAKTINILEAREEEALARYIRACQG